MRANEFLLEIKLIDKEVNNSLPGAFVQPDLRNTDPYMQYRYGLALASARARKLQDGPFEAQSEWSENLALVCFSKEDVETFNLADELMGVTATRIGSDKSVETDVYSVSPVAKPHKNRYGI